MRVAMVIAALALVVGLCAAAFFTWATAYEYFHPCLEYGEKHAKLLTKLLFHLHDCVRRE
jgi:hypothetical protein